MEMSFVDLHGKIDKEKLRDNTADKLLSNDCLPCENIYTFAPDMQGYMFKNFKSLQIDKCQRLLGRATYISLPLVAESTSDVFTDGVLHTTAITHAQRYLVKATILKSVSNVHYLAMGILIDSSLKAAEVFGAKCFNDISYDRSYQTKIITPVYFLGYVKLEVK